MEDRRAGRQQGAAVRRGGASMRAGPAIAVALLCLAAGAGPAARRCEAAPPEGILGWEGDGYDQGYGFAMLGVSLRGGERTSIPLRVTGSYLYYNYVDGSERIDVHGPGCAVLAGVRSAGKGGNVSLLAGGELFWETREHPTSGAEAPAVAASAVARGGAVAQLAGELNWGRRLHPFLLGNVSSSSMYGYGRVGLRCQVSNLDWRGPHTWSLGLEGIAQGNADTDALQAGAAVECAFVPSRISFSVRGGYKNSAAPEGGRRDGGYVGAGLYRRF